MGAPSRGAIEVDNEEHCDFVKLRQMLIHTSVEELREHTNDVLMRTGAQKSWSRWALYGHILGLHPRYCIFTCL